MTSKNHGPSHKKPMIFSSWNYKVLALGIVMVLGGFLAMYWENEVNGFISLYVSPIVIMGGYVAVVVAILKHDTNGSAENG